MAKKAQKAQHAAEETKPTTNATGTTGTTGATGKKKGGAAVTDISTATAAPTKKGKGKSTPGAVEQTGATVPAGGIPVGDAARADGAPLTTDAEFNGMMDKLAELVDDQTNDAAYTAPFDPNWVAPNPVGSSVNAVPSEVDMDHKRNGRSINPAVVKEYATDFVRRIKAGEEPQLQECAGYYIHGNNTLHLVFGFHRGMAAVRANEALPGLGFPPMTLRVRIVPQPVGAKGLLDNWAENKHHNTLTAVSEMRYMARLRDEYGMGHKEIAQALGVSPSLVSLRLKLELLSPAILKLVDAGVVPVKSGYQLADIEDVAKREKALAKLTAVLGAAGDLDNIKAIKLPKTAIIAGIIDEANGGEAAGAGVSNPSVAGGAVLPGTPKPLSTKKIEGALQTAIQHTGAPKGVKDVLRPILGWVLGQRTPQAMLKAIFKVLELDAKEYDIEGMAGVVAMAAGAVGVGQGEAQPAGVGATGSV